MAEPELRLRLSFGGADASLVYRSLCGVIDALMANDGVPLVALERMSHGLAEIVDAVFVGARVTEAEVTTNDSGLVASMSYEGAALELDLAGTQIAQGAFDEVRQQPSRILMRVRSVTQ